MLPLIFPNCSNPLNKRPIKHPQSLKTFYTIIFTSHQELLKLTPKMCQERTETWLCKYCYRYLRSETYKIWLCDGFKRNGVCTEVKKTLPTTIYQNDPDCKFCNAPRKWPDDEAFDAWLKKQNGSSRWWWMREWLWRFENWQGWACLLQSRLQLQLKSQTPVDT